MMWDYEEEFSQPSKPRLKRVRGPFLIAGLLVLVGGIGLYFTYPELFPTEAYRIFLKNPVGYIAGTVEYRPQGGNGASAPASSFYRVMLKSGATLHAENVQLTADGISITTSGGLEMSLPRSEVVAIRRVVRNHGTDQKIEADR